MKLNRTRLLPHAMTILSLSLIVAATLPSYAAENTNETPAKHLGSIEREGINTSNELLGRAVAYLNTNGAEKSFSAFNDRKGSFVNKAYYVFVVDKNGVLRASGGEPGWQLGKDVKDLHDAAGKNFVSDMLELAKTKDTGTVEYRWLNRFDNHIEVKTSQFRKVGDYLVCVGYYIPRASEEEATALLNRAVAYLKKSGKTRAFMAFNDPKSGFVINDEYVFVIGINDGKYRASGASPQMTGVDMTSSTDAAGHPIFQEMIALAKSKGEGTIDYVWRNPATNAVEQKHTRIQRVGDVLVGVGYYTNN